MAPGYRAALWLSAAATMLSLAGCVSADTPYQALSSASRVSGGYADERLAEDRYRVTFAGNTFTSRERVESYLLFRSAELTLQQGFDWFLVQDQEMDHLIEREIRPDPYFRPWYGPQYEEWRPYWRYRTPGAGWQEWDPYHGDRFWAGRVDVRTVERFEATAEIKLGRGDTPVGEGAYFDARRVMADIGSQIEYPENRSPAPVPVAP